MDQQTLAVSLRLFNGVKLGLIDTQDSASVDILILPNASNEGFS